MGKTNEIIDSLRLDDISEVYLFFDYDCHGIFQNKTNKKQLKDFNENLHQLLELCNESTNQFGKPFISYPMVESLWDIPKDNSFSNCNNNCFIKISDFKKYIMIIGNKNPDRQARMNIDQFKKYLSIHLDRFLTCIDDKKDTTLSSDSYSDIIEYDLIKLHKIESALAEKQNKIFAINPLPLFLLEIGGKKQFENFLTDLEKIGCKCDYKSCMELLITVRDNITKSSH